VQVQLNTWRDRVTGKGPAAASARCGGLQYAAFWAPVNPVPYHLLVSLSVKRARSHIIVLLRIHPSSNARVPVGTSFYYMPVSDACPQRTRWSDFNHVCCHAETVCLSSYPPNTASTVA
jgi:hypothetical protein